ncbi:hypothetical protein ABBQ38_000827 [Trebouxia sp. C0009 RCD-2024]
MQQLKKRLESSPASTSAQQARPDVSNLENKVQRIEQAAMQQANQGDEAARQLKANMRCCVDFLRLTMNHPTV